MVSLLYYQIIMAETPVADMGCSPDYLRLHRFPTVADGLELAIGAQLESE